MSVGSFVNEEAREFMRDRIAGVVSPPCSISEWPYDDLAMYKEERVFLLHPPATDPVPRMVFEFAADTKIGAWDAFYVWVLISEAGGHSSRVSRLVQTVVQGM